MFSKIIIDGDKFLDIPLSSQALYFHLGMRADDDGFINCPKKIQRMVGASDDDLEILIEKGFLIAFESGIVVIKHWRMHNCLRKDRHNGTIYTEEKSRLSITENGTYIHNVTPVCLEKVQDESTLNSQDGMDLKEERMIILVVNEYNRICVSFPKVHDISDHMKETIRESLKTNDIRIFMKLFKKAEGSSFLKGKNDNNWTASFDWLIATKNMEKVLAGQYDEWDSDTSDTYD